MTTSRHGSPDEKGRVAREMKTILEAPPPSVAIRHIRHVTELDAPRPPRDTVAAPAGTTSLAGAHGVTTRELSSRELAHELEQLRLTGQEVSTRPFALPSSLLPITLEMSLDELLPPAEQALLVRGEAPPPAARAVVHTDATPTLIARTSDLFPLQREADDAPRSDLPPAARYKGPTPSVAPAPAVAEAPSRRGAGVAAALVTAFALGAALLALSPDALGVASGLRAVRALLAPATSGRAPAPPASRAESARAATSLPPDVGPELVAALSAHPQRAAELYEAGRFKEALAEYRMLAALHPGRPAYAARAHELRRRLLAACVRARRGHLSACDEL